MIGRILISRLPEKQKEDIRRIYKHYRSLFRVYKLRLQLMNLSSKPKIKKQSKMIKRKGQNFGYPYVLQKTLDSLSYPPNHDYELNSLKTRGELTIRKMLFDTICPTFFTEGKEFLDIGCNKGYFSLLASQTFDHVDSIDNDYKYAKICTALKRENMDVYQTSFRNFAAKREYDRILIGNVAHYLFIECRGHEWIYKLAAISKGLVLIESPFDMTCQDMQGVIPKELESEFTYEKFIASMEKFFALVGRIPSNSQGRSIMVFLRIHDIEETEYEISRWLKPIEILSESVESYVFTTKINEVKCIAKVDKEPKEDLMIKIRIASYSPISNGFIGWITSNGNVIGWIEEYNSSPTYKYFENQRELFSLICDHNIYLAKIGYMDLDLATINFFKNNNKMFDKGLVMPISEMTQDTWLGKKFQQDHFFIHLNQSYDIIPQAIQNLMRDKFKTKDPEQIENIFRDMKELVN